MQTNVSIRKKPAEIRDWPLVSWWIRVTSPAPGSPRYGHNPQWREEVASLLFLMVFLQVLMSTISTALDAPSNLPILLSVIIIDVVALFLKRSGRLYIAGTIILTTNQLGLCLGVLGPGMLTIPNLELLSLLVQSAVISMGFFPPVAVLVICSLNCFIILFTLKFFPHVAALDLALTQQLSNVATPLILLQSFVAGVSFITIRALLKEIKRADNAEELAQLRQSEAELRMREAQQAQQLEEGIQVILQALNIAAAKGDVSMRVPLAQENILWRVGYSINNLLARLQGFRQEKAELEKTRVVAHQLAECIRQKQPYPFNQWTGTSLDQLIIELNKQLDISIKPSNGPVPHTTSRQY